jgi:phosphatidylglycerophosphatase A
VNRLLLWIAQGFGLGRLAVAPGTFGSLGGLAWFALLLLTGQWWGFMGGLLAALALSVWLSGLAEKLLQKKDPGSVVLDEIAAVPLCFVGWVAIAAARSGSWPGPGGFCRHRTWLLSLAVFAAFRLFDVLKPWPVRQSQALPGGWGITADDVLAAVYVNAIFFPLWWAFV